MLKTTLKTLFVVLVIGAPTYLANQSNDIITEDKIVDVTAEMESTFCKLHHVNLQPDIVPVAYGLLVTTSPDNFKPVFPYSNRYYAGGCVINPYSSPLYAKVLFCPQCRKAENWWRIKYAFGLANPRSEFKKWRAQTNH